jgi:hypothetical protein
MSLVIGRRLSFEGCGEGIRGLADFPDGVEALSNGEALPVAMVLSVLLPGARDAADCLVHHELRVNLFFFTAAASVRRPSALQAG